MPLLKNAQKALRSSRRKAVINSRLKSQVKTSIDAMKQKPSPDGLSKAFSSIDRAVKGHIFHANKAGRLKHQLSRLISV